MNNIILKKFVGRVERPHSYCKSKKKVFSNTPNKKENCYGKRRNSAVISWVCFRFVYPFLVFLDCW